MSQTQASLKPFYNKLGSSSRALFSLFTASLLGSPCLAETPMVARVAPAKTTLPKTVNQVKSIGGIQSFLSSAKPPSELNLDVMKLVVGKQKERWIIEGTGCATWSPCKNNLLGFMQVELGLTRLALGGGGLIARPLLACPFLQALGINARVSTTGCGTFSPWKRLAGKQHGQYLDPALEVGMRLFLASNKVDLSGSWALDRSRNCPLTFQAALQTQPTALPDFLCTFMYNRNGQSLIVENQDQTITKKPMTSHRIGALITIPGLAYYGVQLEVGGGWTFKFSAKEAKDLPKFWWRGTLGVLGPNRKLFVKKVRSSLRIHDLMLNPIFQAPQRVVQKLDVDTEASPPPECPLPPNPLIEASVHQPVSSNESEESDINTNR